MAKFVRSILLLILILLPACDWAGTPTPASPPSGVPPTAARNEKPKKRAARVDFYETTGNDSVKWEKQAGIWGLNACTGRFLVFFKGPGGTNPGFYTKNGGEVW